MNDVILSVKKLGVSINGRNILKNINFTIKRGETLAVIGPNGAGKTVLLKTLLGLYPHSGKVSLDKRLRIGYLPQRISLNPYMRLTGYELLEMKRRLLGLPRSSVVTAIKDLGLEPSMLSKQLISLSGGGLQKLFIVFSLIGDPDVIVLDEPTAHIDLAGERMIHATLHRLIKLERKPTIIMASHDLHMISEHADSVLGINGREICFGGTKKMLTQSTLTKLFGEHHRRHYIGRETHGGER
jgi:zinc transport system ATP-binding protein